MLGTGDTHESRRPEGAGEAPSGADGPLAEEIRAFIDARPAPDVSRGVLRTIAREQLRPERAMPSRLDRLALLFWTPRTVTIRPLYAMMSAAVLLLAALAPARPDFPIPPAPPRPAALVPASAGLTAPAPAPLRAVASPRVFVQFRLPLDQATEVRLTGTFTGWQRTHALHETSPGVWTVTIPLEPGVHDYLFIVDGRSWVPDPHAPRVSDGFGGVNSRLALVVPEDDAS